MSLILIAPGRNMHSWKEAILDVDATLDIEIWPEVTHSERVQFAVMWRQPPKIVNHFPNLKAISSLGAGVDHILMDETIPNAIPVCRIIAPSLLQQMKEYVFSAILNYQRDMFTYMQQRLQERWEKHPNKTTERISLGVMGLGALGKPIAKQLADFGYKVSGWSGSNKNIAGVKTYTGKQQLIPFLLQSKILICLLPLTDDTRDLLNLEVFRKMQHPGYLINGARGEHLVEEDLIYALDKGWLEGACLDVFREEPLPTTHPFWSRSNIHITPHISSITHPKEVAAQIVENYKNVLSGLPLNNKIDRQKGY